MPKIKTRDSVKGTIRTIDKARIASTRMKSAYVQVKDKAENSTEAEEYSANEYATDRIESGTKNVAGDTVHHTKKQLQKGTNKIKNRVEEKVESKIRNKSEEALKDKAKNTAKRRTSQSTKNAVKKPTERTIRTTNNAGRKGIRTAQKSASKSIKSTARSAGKQTIKTAGKGSVKTVKTSVKTAQKTSKAAIKTSKQVAKATQRAAKASAQAAKKAAQAAKATAKATAQAIKIAIKATIAAIKAIIAGIKALVSAIAAGGWVAVLIILVICLIGLVIYSCYGIFCSNEDSGNGITMSSVVQEINEEYNQKIENIKKENTYDILDVSGSKAEWKEVLAVFAVDKTMVPDNPANSDEPVQVATMDEDKKADLKTLFWDVNSIEHKTETKTVKETVEEKQKDGKIKKVQKNVKKTTLIIKTMHKSLETIMQDKNFSQEQMKMVYELLDDDNNLLWLEVLHGVTSSDGDIVNIAKEQLGNTGGQPYWSWYGFSSRVEWCACFVSWCANECGYIDSGLIPKYSLCDTGVQWFKDKGEWIDGSAEPKAGMIIFFDWADDGLDGSSDHTGIVEKVEDGQVYTIEGNSGDACQEHSYPVGYNQILGYGAPAY